MMRFTSLSGKSFRSCGLVAIIVSMSSLLYGGDAGGMREQARDAFLKGEYAKALQAYRDLARNNPDIAHTAAREFERMLFERAYEHAMRKEFEKYREALNTLRQMDPTPEEIAALINVTGEEKIQEMYIDDALSNRDLEWMLSMFRRYRRARLVDDERMKALTAALVDPAKSDVERARILREIEILGQYTIPYLLKYVADERQEEKKTIALEAVILIGERAVLPCVELLRHADATMQIHAANVLREIRPVDARAVATLKWLIEDPSTSPVVVGYATEAFFNITGLDPKEGRSAAEYFFQLSNRYYMNEPTVTDESFIEDGLIWQLTALPDEPTDEDRKAQTLEYMKVKPYAWNELVAERFARRGVLASKENSGQDSWFYPLLSCIYAAQYQEVKYLLDIVAEDPRGRPLTDEELLEIKARYVRYSSRCKFIARSMGPKFNYQALGKAMADKRPEVAAFLLELLPSLDPTGTLLPPIARPAPKGKPGEEKDADAEPEDKKPEPAAAPRRSARETILVGNMPYSERYEGVTVSRALSNPDQRVRFAAAVALARMNPPAKYDGHDKVARILADALSVASKPVILLVHENNSERNRIREALEALGYSVSEARDGDEGLAAALQYPPKDMIILDANLERRVKTRNVIDALQEDPRTRAIPYAIIGNLENAAALKEKFGTDVELIPEQFKDLGTTKGEVTEATVDTLGCRRAAFTTLGSGLQGSIIRIITGKGRGQSRKILKNDKTTLTVETPWQIVPENGSTFEIEAGANQRLQYPIEKMLTGQELPSITRLYSNQIAIAAAIALAEMDPERTVIVKEDLFSSISSVLSSSISNDLRLQLIKAARNLKVGAAVGALEDIAKNTQHTSDIRTAAVEALAHISPGEYVELGFGLITEGSEDIRRAISELLGRGAFELNDNKVLKRALDTTPAPFSSAPAPVVE